MIENSQLRSKKSVSHDAADQTAVRPSYEPPRLLKKRSVERVTLFSGGGVAGGGGITAAG